MFEINFDGIPGPTHFYGGLSSGNIASQSNHGQSSFPKLAALQGLKKMEFFLKRGQKQSFIPPLFRPCVWKLSEWFPNLETEKALDFCKETNPKLLEAIFSSSSMWTANAATVTSSIDSQDHKVHFSVANLSNKLHRSIEAPETYSVLKQIFFDQNLFEVHPPLFDGESLGDEGAANHCRFTPSHDQKGLHLFVYGRQLGSSRSGPVSYPARQTKEASQIVAHRHGIASQQQFFVQQNSKVIDQGVFHNDVISVGHLNFFFVHESAFEDTQKVVSLLQEKYTKLHPGKTIRAQVVTNEEVSVLESIESYLFNSQIIEIDKKLILIAPLECQENENIAKYLARLRKENVFHEVVFLDVRQSMKNGGGPACLRLRVPLLDEEWDSLPEFFKLDLNKIGRLKDWIENFYPETFSPHEIKDWSEFLKNQERGFKELENLIGLERLIWKEAPLHY